MTMIGYFNNPEKTKETLKDDGWLLTGDLAYLNDNGYLHIKGRSKEMIIRYIFIYILDKFQKRWGEYFSGRNRRFFDQNAWYLKCCGSRCAR